MKSPLKTATILTLVWLLVAYFVLPVLSSRLIGRHSVIRLDPKASADYNCIFVEAHARKNFRVSWLFPSTPTHLIRLRYTPHDEDQPYGIMYIDPRSLAYEVSRGFVSAPSSMSGILESPKPIMEWMRAQAGAKESPSHTNESRDVFAVVEELRNADLEHFVLPTNFVAQNFVVGHQSRPESALSNWSISALLLTVFWLPVLAAWKRKGS